MLKNYLKIAIRSLQRQKVFAFINVFGLSVGIACFSLLLLFAFNEFSFDKFHKNAANIYRPFSWEKSIDGQLTTGYTDVGGSTAATLGEAMKQYLPDVMDYVRLQLPWGENLLRTDKDVHRASVTWADPSLFSVFTFPLKYGNATTALLNMNDIVFRRLRLRFSLVGGQLVGGSLRGRSRPGFRRRNDLRVGRGQLQRRCGQRLGARRRHRATWFRWISRRAAAITTGRRVSRS